MCVADRLVPVAPGWQAGVDAILVGVDEGALGMRAPEQVEVSVGIAAWATSQDWQAMYQAADGDLYQDKRRRKTVRRWQQEDQPSPVRILGRGAGRRRASGA